MGLSVAKLAEYMGHGLNIYITGEAGTGKTRCLQAAAKLANLKMGYMSAPTLDPWIDLIGLPTAEYNEALKRKVLEFIRKKEFGDIEVLFIDELPRGELKTLNAIFELLQDGTINGEAAIPSLKCVVGAGNPMTDDYTGQNQLDAALLDRMDIYLETDTKADLAYFVDTFGKAVGKALVDWHKAHNAAEDGYLSPRRLEKIGHTWKLMPELGTIKAMVPLGGTFKVDILHRALTDAIKGEKIGSDPNAKLADRIPFMDVKEIRNSRDEIIDLLPKVSPTEAAKITESVARALTTGVKVDTIVNNWGPVLEYFSHVDEMSMVKDWAQSRQIELRKKSIEAEISIGKNLMKI